MFGKTDYIAETFTTGQLLKFGIPSQSNLKFWLKHVHVVIPVTIKDNCNSHVIDIITVVVAIT